VAVLRPVSKRNSFVPVPEKTSREESDLPGSGWLVIRAFFNSYPRRAQKLAGQVRERFAIQDEWRFGTDSGLAVSNS
jgi:hypothetical protein